MLRLFIILAVTLMASGRALGAATEKGGTDYYSGKINGDPAAFEATLEMVAGRHLPPCLDFYRAKKYLDSFANCTFTLVAFPNHPQSLNTLAQICEVWKDPHCVSLDEYFERAIAKNPNASPTYVIIGLHQARIKKTSDAIKTLKHAIELDPNSINAHYNLALVYFEAKEFEFSNQHAQLAYQLGASLPGLRDKLKRVDHWKPADMISPGATGSPAPQQ